MAKGEAWREGSGCGGRDGADCGERGDARVLLCQALSCGSCGLQSTHDWEAEGVAGDPTLEPTTSLSLPPLPPALSVPLSLLHTHCLVPTQASSSFPGPLPTPSLLLVSVHTQGGPRGFFLHPGLTLSLPCSHTSHGSPVPPDKDPAPQPGVPLSPIRALYFTSHGFTLKLWGHTPGTCSVTAMTTLVLTVCVRLCHQSAASLRSGFWSYSSRVPSITHHRGGTWWGVPTFE